MQILKPQACLAKQTLIAPTSPVKNMGLMANAKPAVANPTKMFAPAKSGAKMIRIVILYAPPAAITVTADFAHAKILG
ncbi:hypothetical protein COT68_03385 [bacterium (Candidatus Torokbacteria) CG09_land_8_20_14_0_10_42_11]|nr:MAG: hypothetical protein COT68_03385 [bacterium (Candidatus Torokbacteria) CG09_land_8_20_14_0_10_42_11]